MVRLIFSAFALLLPLVFAADPPNPVTEALRLAARGQYFQAEQQLKTLAEKTPSEPAVAAGLGELYYRFGHYSAAQEWFGKALKQKPADPELRGRLAVCLFKTGNNDSGAASAQKLLAEHPLLHDVDLLLTYAEYLFERGRLDDAHKWIQAAITAEGNHPIAYLWLARVLLARKDLPAATRAAERSVLYGPELPYAHNLLIRLYRMQGRTSEAETQARWVQIYELRKVRQ